MPQIIVDIIMDVYRQVLLHLQIEICVYSVYFSLDLSVCSVYNLIRRGKIE
jgi:hypothetical protein